MNDEDESYDNQNNQSSYVQVVSANRSVNNSTARFSNRNRVVAQTGTGAEGTRVQFETFDSSMDDRRDEKMVFKFINRGDEKQLKEHLDQVKEKVDLTKIYDRSGYSPLHFAAFKNHDQICKALCDHVVRLDANA